MYVDTVYHKCLRVSVAVVALVLAFQTGLVLPSQNSLSYDTRTYLANVISITAGVAPTEINMLTAELTERQRELEQREMVLSEREIDAQVRDANGSTPLTNYLTSIVLLLLLLLIVANYAFDFIRARKRIAEGYEAVA